MPLRDLFILAIYIPGLLYGFKKPFIALMVYYWISFMNPHRLGWGMTADMPLAMFAAVVTIISMIMHYQDLKFPAIKETFIFLLFWLFVTITTVFSFYPDDAWSYWFTVSKIFLMVLLTMIVVNTPKNLFFLLIGIILFIGFYGVKGAIFGILTGGQYRVWGPPYTYIADNNDMGLAFVMVAPLCFFLRDIFSKKILSHILIIIGIMIIISTILTYSRGALVGLITMVFFAISQSKHKIIIIMAVALIGMFTVPLLPSHWFDRMSTIQSYEEDQSANMRLNSWAMSINLASDNFWGGGFLCWSSETYHKYSPEPELGGGGSTAHSIYFQILGEHGFIGLIIYLVVIFLVIKNLMKMNKLKNMQDEHYTWVAPVHRALLVSVIAFLASGAFLSRAYFDLFWAIFAAAVCLKYMLIRGEFYFDENDKFANILRLPSIKY